MTSGRLSVALQRPGHEPELHGQRQPGSGALTQPPFTGDLRRDGGDAEPEPHGQELRERNESEGGEPGHALILAMREER